LVEMSHEREFFGCDRGGNTGAPELFGSDPEFWAVEREVLRMDREFCGADHDVSAATAGFGVQGCESAKESSRFGYAGSRLVLISSQSDTLGRDFASGLHDPALAEHVRRFSRATIVRGKLRQAGDA
jgi:hypothetical protein